ncbi:MAG: PHP domain-containing protein [Phycisphaeraceae bacterium]|nr:PHP domain-containing protein [Phycisphaeraceae bacterium]
MNKPLNANVASQNTQERKNDKTDFNMESTSIVNNAEKEKRFCFPENITTSFARKMAVVAVGEVTVCATTKILGHTYAIHLLISGPDGDQRIDHPCQGYAHHSSLVAQDQTHVGIFYNEYVQEQWQVVYLCLDLATGKLSEPEQVMMGQELIHPPVAACSQRGLFVAWPESDGQHIRIRIAKRQGSSWELYPLISGPQVNAFRPVITACEDAIFVAWDEYKNQTYQVVLASSLAADEPFKINDRLGDVNERWLNPTLVANSPSEVYVACLVLQTVTDERGVVDHYPFASAAIWDGQIFKTLAAQNKLSATKVIADFRDGTLPSETYKGYLGWRREPQLTRLAGGNIYLLWESRPESSNTSVEGQLLGRQLHSDGTCGPVEQFANSGYSYAVANHSGENQLTIGLFVFENENNQVMQAQAIKTDDASPCQSPANLWARWDQLYTKRPTPPRMRIQHDDKAYSLFWADTHCHSNFSPDAEGEVDELIHFARDVAGLDALCIIDNDYYPHKALMDAEWQIHQDHSRLFSKDKEFVVFPGYEFTFHDRALTPHFNHRCVVFQEAGGNLVRRIDPGVNHETELYAKLNQTPVMCYPHHPTFRLSDSSREWNVEVCSSWRVCIEESDFSRQQLRQGKVFGFIGSSDTHRCVPGLGGAMTGLLATDLTPRAMFDAYRSRRIIATQGVKVAIDFRINNHLIGSQIQSDRPARMTACVQSPEPIEFVEIIRDGIEVVYQQEVGREQCELEFIDKDTLPGTHFYFLRVKLQGETSFNDDPAKNNHWPFTKDSRYPHNLAKAHGCFAWTSPIWVTR